MWKRTFLYVSLFICEYSGLVLVWSVKRKEDCSEERMVSICCISRRIWLRIVCFPFEANPSVKVKVSFKIGDKKLIVERWEGESEV